MEKIKIETTQHVDIEYEIASVGDRIVATLIDGLIMAGYLFLMFILYYNIVGDHGGTAASVVFIILLLPIWLYHLLCEVFMNGQSFGKRSIKTKVIRLDGRQPTFGNYFMRWILRIIDIGFFYIGAIVLVFNDKGQRIGDIAAGTTVVKLRPREQISNTAFEKTGETYTPVFPEAARLTDNDAYTIKQVLRLTVTDAPNISEIDAALAAKLKAHLNIKTGLSDRSLLQTLLKDYNIINGKL